MGTTTTPPDEVEEGEGIPPVRCHGVLAYLTLLPARQAMFITVKYGYELEKTFNTDVPCKMLMARIIKVVRPLAAALSHVAVSLRRLVPCQSSLTYQKTLPSTT